MSTKEKILSLVHTFSDNVSIDEVIDRLYLLQKVEIGILQADTGDVLDHDDFMRQLLDEEDQGHLDSTSTRRSS